MSVERTEGASTQKTEMPKLHRFSEFRHEHSVGKGAVRTDMAVTTSAGETEDVLWNGSTQKYELSTENKKVEKKNEKNSLWNLLSSGGVGLATYGVSGFITKKKWLRGALGLGAMFLSANNGLLRNSLSPLLSSVSKLLPEGTFKKTVQQWSLDTNVDYEADPLEGLKSEDFATQQMGHVSDLSERGIHHTDKPQQMRDYMWRNGAMFGAKQLGHGRGTCVLMTVSEAGEGCTELAETRNASASLTSELEADWETRLAAAQTEEERQVIFGEMTQYYQGVFDGVGSYNEGAMSSINRDFAGDPMAYTMATSGLEMTNRAVMEPVLDSMHRMNEKYHIYDMDDMYLLDSYPITGIGLVSEYEPGCFDMYAQNTATEVQMAQELDMYDMGGVGPTSSGYLDRPSSLSAGSQQTQGEADLPATEGTEPEQKAEATEPESKKLEGTENKAENQPEAPSETEGKTEEEKPKTSGNAQRPMPDISGILVPRTKDRTVSMQM